MTENPSSACIAATLAALAPLAATFAAAPVLAPIDTENGSPRVTANIPIGKTLVLPLRASDPDGDLLSFSVSGSNPNIMARVRTGCPILKIHVSYAGDPDHKNANNQPAPIPPFEGDMEFQLFRDAAPVTSGLIGGAAQAGFYDNLIFHRVIPDFVIQGGDPAGTGSGDPGFSFPHEFRPELIFSGRGQLAMANSNGGYERGTDFQNGFIRLGNFDPSNSSQFFVTLGQPRHLDFLHTIFGQLVRGFDVLDKFETVSRNASDKPTVPVRMTAISFTPGTSDATLLLSATGAGRAMLTVTAKDPSGGRATQQIEVKAKRDQTNNPPLLRPMPNLISPVGVGPRLPIAGLDLEHDYLLYGIASAGGNTTPGAFGQAQLSQNFTPRSSAGFQSFAVGVAGYNDPRIGARPTAGNGFAPFDPYHFQVVEIGYGERPISASNRDIEGAAGAALTAVTIAEFRDGDAGSSPEEFSATVNWGDGSAQQDTSGASPAITIERATTFAGYVVKGTHTYAKPGVYLIETMIDASLGAMDRTYSQVTIAPAGAVLHAKGASVAFAGATFRDRILASFSDSTPGATASDFTARIDWGDGATSDGVIAQTGPGEFSVTGQHTYRDPEAFAVFVHIRRGGASPAQAVAWSRVSLSGFSAPRHLPPFSLAHLNGQISTLNGVAFSTTTGAGAEAETRFAVSLIVVNSGNLPSKLGELRFYLSRDEQLNLTRIDRPGTDDDEPADIPLKIGPLESVNLSSLAAGGGLQYQFVPTTAPNGQPLDLRLVAPKGQSGAAQYILARLGYSDPLADLMPISKDVIFGRVPGIKVSKSTMSLTEAAGPNHAKTFKVVLGNKPRADVTMALTLSDSTQITLDKSALTFSKTNWNVPQSVLVTAIDDTTVENVTATRINIGPAASTDEAWNTMTADSVTVSVTSNDTTTP